MAINKIEEQRKILSGLVADRHDTVNAFLKVKDGGAEKGDPELRRTLMELRKARTALEQEQNKIFGQAAEKPAAKAAPVQQKPAAAKPAVKAKAAVVSKKQPAKAKVQPAPTKVQPAPTQAQSHDELDVVEKDAHGKLRPGNRTWKKSGADGVNRLKPANVGKKQRSKVSVPSVGKKAKKAPTAIQVAAAHTRERKALAKSVSAGDIISTYRPNSSGIHTMAMVSSGGHTFHCGISAKGLITREGELIEIAA